MTPQPGPRSESNRPRPAFANPLVRHVSAILIAKLVLLAALWWAFFHTADRPEVNVEQVHVRLIGEQAAPSRGLASN